MTETHHSKELQSGMANILMQGILNGFVSNISIFDEIITANDNDTCFGKMRFDVSIGKRRFSFHKPLSSPSCQNHTHTTTHEIGNTSGTK